MNKSTFYYILSSALFILLGLNLVGQETIVKGQIIDAESGEILPFSSVVFSGTSQGTATDLNGIFELKTNDLTLKKITASYLGYEPKEIKINPGKLNEIKKIKLKEVKVELDIVEVKAKRKVPKDTAAIALFRKVVKNKYRNDPSQYDNYKYEQYDKTEFGFYNVSDGFKESKLVKRIDFILENMDTLENGIEVLPVLLKETVNKYYYRKNPKKEKEILIADKFSGVDNFSISEVVDYNFESIEVYGNLIRVNGKPIMSPFADNARFTYKYFLTDTSEIDGLTCFKLDFTGRGNSDAVFSGYAWIHDSTYAIKSIQLKVLPGANVNFITDFIVKQEFEFLDGKHWFKDYEFLQTQYNIIQKKKKPQQSLLVRKSSHRSDIAVNTEIDDAVFDGEPDIVLEGARERSEEFWDTLSTRKLNKREKNIYATVDSVKSTAFYKTVRWFTYLVSSGWLDLKYVELGKIYQFYSFNDVEGNRFRVTMKTNTNFSKRVQFVPHIAYGTKDKQWKYGIKAFAHLKRENEKWHALQAEYRFDLSQSFDVNTLLKGRPEYDNIVNSLLRKDPIRDLFLIREANVAYSKEWVKGLNTRLAFNHKQHITVPTGRVFTTSDDMGAVADTIDKFTTSDITFNFLWARGLKFYNHPFGRNPLSSHKPLFSFDYTAGIKGLFGGDYNFHKFNFNVRQRLLGPVGFTVYQVDAGWIFGKAPYPILYTHRGNGSFLYNAQAYSNMRESEYISDKYISLWITHHFDGFLFNKIPGINKLQLRTILLFKGLYGNINNSNETILTIPGGASELNSFYFETGFGIENILKLLRVDFTWRLTQRDKPEVNKFAFKFTIAPSF